MHDALPFAVSTAKIDLATRIRDAVFSIRVKSLEVLMQLFDTLPSPLMRSRSGVTHFGSSDGNRNPKCIIVGARGVSAKRTDGQRARDLALCGLRRFYLVHDPRGGAAPTASSADANSPVSIASISRKYL